MRAWLVAIGLLASCSRSRELPTKWKLEISFGAGLCQETETESCTTSWEVTETGPIKVTEQFRGGPKTREIALTNDERKELDHALSAAKFWDGLESKDPCPGTVHDLWVNLTFTNRDDGTTRSHNITACTVGNDHGYFAEDVMRLARRR